MSFPAPGSALLDQHVSFTGTVSGHDLIVVGALEGDLRLTGRLHAAPASRLKARVQAQVVELEGEFDGEIRAQTLRVTSSARARGTFRAERLSIEEGAVLEGSVQAPAASAELALAAPAAAAQPAVATAPAAAPAPVAQAQAADEEPATEESAEATEDEDDTVAAPSA